MTLPVFSLSAWGTAPLLPVHSTCQRFTRRHLLIVISAAGRGNGRPAQRAKQQSSDLQRLSKVRCLCELSDLADLQSSSHETLPAGFGWCRSSVPADSRRHNL